MRIVAMAGFLIIGIPACMPGGAAHAQQPDLDALRASTDRLRIAERYDEALAEAERYRSAVRDRFGTSDFYYGVALVKIANVYGQTGKADQAFDLLQQAYDIEEKSSVRDPVEFAKTLNNLGNAQRGRRNLVAAEDLLQRALAINRKELGPEDALVALNLNNLGILYRDEGKNAKAEEAYLQALAIDEKTHGPDDPSVASTAVNLGELYWAQKKYDQALVLFQRALNIRENTLGPDHSSVAHTLNDIGGVEVALLRYYDAEAAFLRALAIREKNNGANSLQAAFVLNNLGNVYRLEKKYDKSDVAYQRSLSIRERTPSSDDSGLEATLRGLGDLYRAKGREADREAMLLRLLGSLERTRGPDHTSVAMTLVSLAGNYQSQNRYNDGERAYERALSIYDKANDKMNLAKYAIYYAVLLRSEDKYAEGEPLYKRALSIYQEKYGAGDPRTVIALAGLAKAYRMQGKYAQAGALLQEALAIQTKAYGPDSLKVASILPELALQFDYEGKSEEALLLVKRTLAIQQKSLGPDDPSVARTLADLGARSAVMEPASAQDMLRQALAIQEKSFGRDSDTVAGTLLALGRLYQSNRQFAQAEASFQRALEISEKYSNPSNVSLILAGLSSAAASQQKFDEAVAYRERGLAIDLAARGPSNPLVAQDLNGLSWLQMRLGNLEKATELSRRATNSVIELAASENQTSGAISEGADGLIERRSDLFVRHLANLTAVSRSNKDVARGRLLRGEAFQTAQWASHSSAAAALQQMSARFAAGTGVLADLVRESQDLSRSWKENNDALTAAIVSPNAPPVSLDTEQHVESSETLRRRLGDTEIRMRAARAKLDEQFPEYATLSNPRPTSIEDVQKLLGADEAMVFWLVEANQTAIFAVNRETASWQTIATGRMAFSDKVTAFRVGLDVEKFVDQSASGTPDLFDLNGAHEMYELLFRPIEGVIRGKKQLIVVPTGALTAIPFHLLVTEPPASQPKTMAELPVYSNAAWLLSSYAVSVLPSVASLPALRSYAKRSMATKELIGFGDPVFATEVPVTTPLPSTVPFASAQKAEPTKTTPKAKSSKRPKSRGVDGAYTDFWRGASVDRGALSQALPRLADTADELRDVAKRLGVPASDIHLRTEASEAFVKNAPLSDYRIVYFATHGLVAGDVTGLAEPSLALTLPTIPNDIDDGLLTSSEIAQLKLNADWVVLSACNTAAGDKPGAEALSGLARAFFYAGARALLVSHWAVASNAATAMTTSAFDIIKANPGIGRSEALRRAMLGYMNDKGDPLNVYPAVWGPFALIGEGVGQ